MTPLLSRAVISLLGRRLVVRAARHFSLAARYEGNADMRTNGEMRVLDAIFDRLRTASAPAVLVDCGANRGVYCLELAARARELPAGPATIHAFEPCSTSFAALEATVGARELGNVRFVLNQTALSDTLEESRDLQIVHETAGINSLFSNDIKPSTRSEPVPVTTLDRYALDRGIERIDFLKTDAEGSDDRILAGADGLLASRAVSVLQFEYNHLWIYARSFLRDTLARLLRHGYRVGKVTPAGIEFYDAWHPDMEGFAQSNYVACAPEWAAVFRTVRWWGGSNGRALE